MKIRARVDVPRLGARRSRRRARRPSPKVAVPRRTRPLDDLSAAGDDDHALSREVEAEDIADELALLRNEARRVALVGQGVAQQQYGAGRRECCLVVFTAMAERYEHRERCEYCAGQLHSVESVDNGIFAHAASWFYAWPQRRVCAYRGMPQCWFLWLLAKADVLMIHAVGGLHTSFAKIQCSAFCSLVSYSDASLAAPLRNLARLLLSFDKRARVCACAFTSHFTKMMHATALRRVARQRTGSRHAGAAAGKAAAGRSSSPPPARRVPSSISTTRAYADRRCIGRRHAASNH